MVNQGGKDPKCVRAEDTVNLAFLEGRLAPVTPLLGSLESTFGALFGLESNLLGLESRSPPDDAKSVDTLACSPHWTAIFNNRRLEVESYKHAAQGLLEKCACVQRLAEGLLNYQNQQNVQQQTAATFALTNSTVDDSATVRVITVITVVYLSSTAVAVSELPAAR
jgi:hypothetical protein